MAAKVDPGEEEDDEIKNRAKEDRKKETKKMGSGLESLFPARWTLARTCSLTQRRWVSPPVALTRGLFRCAAPTVPVLVSSGERAAATASRRS